MAVPLPGCAAQRPQQLSSGSSGRQLQQQRQRRPGRRSARDVCAVQNAAQDGQQATQERQQCSDTKQQAAAPSAQTLLQQAARAAAGVAAAAVLALGSLPPPAEAVLANPRAPVARSADVALRRSIPAFNADVAAVQERLEAVAFKLRIPQRKPWKSMGEDVAAAAELAAQQALMLAGVLPGDRPEAEQLVSDIQDTLGRLARAIDVKDPERTSIRVSNALERVAALELLQAPGLPYQLPRQLAGYPALTGRAILELTVEKASGREVFIEQNSDAGPQRRATLRLILDGYSAPITAANLLLNAESGLYNGAALSVSGNAVLVDVPASSKPTSTAGGAAQAAEAEAAGEASLSGEFVPAGGSSGGGSGRQRAVPAALPLEILAQGDFEPLYRSPLDVRSGELPVLPLSIYGAVAMAHLPDSSAGYVSGLNFFIYKFDRQQAGLAGLSFDEGEFGVCGYIVQGLDAVTKLESGDRIVSAKVGCTHSLKLRDSFKLSPQLQLELGADLVFPTFTPSGDSSRGGTNDSDADGGSGAGAGLETTVRVTNAIDPPLDDAPTPVATPAGLHVAGPWVALQWQADPDDRSKGVLRADAHHVSYSRGFTLALGHKGARWELPLDAKLGLTYSGTPHVAVGTSNVPLVLGLATALLIAGKPVHLAHKEVGGLAVHFPLSFGGTRHQECLQERVEVDLTLQRQGRGLRCDLHQLNGVLRLREE